ncbi:PilW family protein [Aeromonas caviae]|uniref:PilW family protein n=1 Tax=Aeromonas caviae TaxID=648 RepID=UPI002B45FDA7|nr:type II secretion system protein [Aeromonas caviae]
MGKPISVHRAAPGSRSLGANPARACGFTLVELVMVILLLGVMATFASQFIGIGTQIYGDASRREQLMSDARFALERLNREVRDAVPGSLRIEDEAYNALDQGSCLRFWPIATASRYLALNLAVSDSASTLALVMATPASAANPLGVDENAVKAGDKLVVFPVPVSNTAEPLLAGCDYGRCVVQVTQVMTPPVSGAQTIHYDGPGLDGFSPASRVYFAREQVRYCVTGTTLTRASTIIGGSLPDPGEGVLMAEHLRPHSYYFYREEGAFNESEVGLRLEFEQRDERVVFHHKLETLNVP